METLVYVFVSAKELAKRPQVGFNAAVEKTVLDPDCAGKETANGYYGVKVRVLHAEKAVAYMETIPDGRYFVVDSGMMLVRDSSGLAGTSPWDVKPFLFIDAIKSIENE